MRLLYEHDVANLADDRGFPRLSIYLPTSRDTTVAEHRIRLKNQLRGAELQLRSDGVRPVAIDEMLQTVRGLADESLFWEKSSDGLAIFVSDVRTTFFQIPLPVHELVTLGERFVVGPLLPMLTNGGHFFVLWVSQADVRFFESTKFGMDEVAVSGLPLPRSIAMSRSRRAPSVFAASRAHRGRSGVRHGVGGVTVPDRKTLISDYFRRVDIALRTVLHNEHAPLVLAGVGHVQALYRRVNTYPRLLRQGINGNPRELAPGVAHAVAYEIAEPWLRLPEVVAADEYFALKGTGRTTRGVDDVVKKAAEGRIDKLFVVDAIEPWIVDEQAPCVVRLGTAMTDGERLDRAALLTLRNSGTVLAVPFDRMPDDDIAVATLRF